MTSPSKNEELRHKSRRVGLMDLPVEVFKHIIKQLDSMAELEVAPSKLANLEWVSKLFTLFA